VVNIDACVVSAGRREEKRRGQLRLPADCIHYMKKRNGPTFTVHPATDRLEAIVEPTARSVEDTIRCMLCCAPCVASASRASRQ